ncbi:MAG: DUF2309 domain-containing protein [Phycisphaerales bacterium]|nr:DUF2309 domain-containing protein [Phycisphaerales bacterium]
MPEILRNPALARLAVPVAEDIARACLLIPPCWGLESFVAVNPFVGHAPTPIDAAARVVRDGLGASLLPPVSHFRQRWLEGAFDRADVEGAARRVGVASDALESMLNGHPTSPGRIEVPSRTAAEWIDWREGTRWNQVVCDALARWCEMEHQSGRSLDAADPARPFARWRAHASVDLSIDIAGLPGFRDEIALMPDDPDAAIERAIDIIGVDFTERDAAFLRLLSGIYGWATHARRIAWERDRNDPGAVRDLLAARACADAAVMRLAPSTGRAVARRSSDPAPVGDERIRLALQEASEDAYCRRLLQSVRASADAEPDLRPAMQAVFCIDVRSEPVRRHLELLSPAVQTKGFAGFFGVAMEWSDADTTSARCPVLLKPACSIQSESRADPLAAGLATHLHKAPASAFASVEIAGLAYAAAMAIGESCLASRERREECAPICLDPESDGSGLGLDAQVRTAEFMLRGMGMHGHIAPVVMLCGHSARSANNPHGTSLDCGACGGHGGAANARVACAILNSPHVRDALRPRGWRIPEDTLFVAAVHDTSDDSIRMLDSGAMPPSYAHALRHAQQMLDDACAAARAERAPSLGVRPRGGARRLLAALRRRTRDWAEVRPEWGLAGNAAFIAARRSRTRGVDLGSRTFLHDYDADADTDGALLDLILSAPMVVASWINLQYLASTVDPEVLGAGDKVLHNRIGRAGVAVGNGGDLRTGLPLQSVQAADGSWRHEPLRLQVIVEAPTSRIDGVLANQRHVADLVENGWVRLFALDPQGGAHQRFVPGEGWEPA